MTGLRDLQTGFARALLGDAAAAAGLPIVGDGLDPAARLAVYRHHVTGTLSDVLRAAFPVVARLVGEGFFAYATHAFVRAHPPPGPCLHEYGADLPAFLAAFSPARSVPYLPDVARLEWALHAAVHAPDAAPVDAEALRRVPRAAWADARLGLHPAAAFVASPWPVDHIWAAHQDGEAPRVDLDAGGARLQVRRRGDDVVFRPLDAPTFALRAALGAGQPLGRAVAAALAASAGLDVTQAMRALLDEGLVVAVTHPPTDKETDHA